MCIRDRSSASGCGRAHSSMLADAHAQCCFYCGRFSCAFARKGRVSAIRNPCAVWGRPGADALSNGAGSALAGPRSDHVVVDRIQALVQSMCQIGSMLTARSPQSEQRNRRSSSLNASMSAPSSSSGPSLRVLPHDRQMARALISKSSQGLRSGRIVSRSAFQQSAWQQAHSAHRK